MDQVRDTKVEEVCQVRLDLLDERERYKALTKLHKQFVHPSRKNNLFHGSKIQIYGDKSLKMVLINCMRNVKHVVSLPKHPQDQL